MDEQTKMKQQKNVIKLSGKNKQRVSKLKMQFVLKDGYLWALKFWNTSLQCEL